MDKEQRLALRQFVQNRWREIQDREFDDFGSRDEVGNKIVYSQAELARRAGVTTATLSRLLTMTGTHGPDDENLWKLHQYLGTDKHGNTIYSVVGRREPIPDNPLVEEFVRGIVPNTDPDDLQAIIDFARDRVEQRQAEKRAKERERGKTGSHQLNIESA